MHTQVRISTHASTHSYDLEETDVWHIEDSAFAEARRVESEMLVIMEEQQENQDQHDISNASFCSSFSRICSDELNHIGYDLNRISPITFEGDVFQTPNNRTQGRALMSTPRKKERESHSESNPQGPPINKIFSSQLGTKTGGYDEGIFNAVAKLLSEKIEQAKCSGSSDTKTINAIEHENFCNFFKIPEQLYNAAFTQVVRESTPKILGNDSN